MLSKGLPFKNIDIHKFWRKKTFINYLLLPLSLLWIVGSQLRKLKSSYKSKAFVVCLGNINLGGSGKTPSAIFIGNELSKKGFKVAFLTKGYGGFAKQAWVKQNQNPLYVGDEPLLLAKHLPTLVSKNMIDGLKILEADGFDIIITDDGFQNPTFKKDFNLLIVNGDYGFGNKLIFPAGPLRERISGGFKKADSVFLLEKSNIDIKHLAEKYSLNMFEGKYEPQEDIPVKTGDKVLAFCGIGIPDKFKKTLEHQGIVIEKFVAFKDHHFYSKSDMKYLIKKAKSKNLSILTTEKDYIKIPLQYKAKILSFNINLVLQNSNLFINKIVDSYEKKEKTK